MARRFSIDPISDPLELCIPDPTTNPTRPMQLWLALALDDCSLSLQIGYSIDGAPIETLHGMLRRYPVLDYTDTQLLTQDINAGQLDDLLSRIVDGANIYHNGSNYVARLSLDALDAELDLRQRLVDYLRDNPNFGLSDAREWFYDSTPAELGITATTTDDELTALADKLEAEARSDGAVLYDTVNALTEKRDELKGDN